jgi:hypothetical protein
LPARAAVEDNRAAQAMPPPTSTSHPRWWREAVFYEIDPRRFEDTNVEVAAR